MTFDQTYAEAAEGARERAAAIVAVGTFANIAATRIPVHMRSAEDWATEIMEQLGDKEIVFTMSGSSHEGIAFDMEVRPRE